MQQLPLRFRLACRQFGVRLTENVLFVDIRQQKMAWAKPVVGNDPATSPIEPPLPRPAGALIKRVYRVSTSRFGAGEEINSNCTPRGLHRITSRFGGGWPTGAAFRSRTMVGYTWDGQPGAPITNRILWLEGLEPGRNRGGKVDTFARYIYIHGTGDEPTLGRPASRGCIHMAGTDLLPLYDALPLQSLVWID